MASLSLIGNSSTKGHTSSSIEEFSILELFAVNGHLDKSPTIKHVDWLSPHCDWFKCNTAKGFPGNAGGGGIFRDKSAVVLGCFATYYGIAHSIHAELLAVFHAIELAHQKGWHPLWLECDSTSVVLAFSGIDMVSW